jgi:membrane associated rhomboid family serine protease
MNDSNLHPLEAILISCAQAGQSPWYPSDFAQASGIPRDSLDAYLDELRLGGLVRLTDWEQGRGQGYALTPEGADVVRDPRLMQKIRTNGVPRKPVEALKPAERSEGNATAWERGEAVRAVLLAPKTPVVTMVLIFLNVMVFSWGGILAYQRRLPIHLYVAGSAGREADLNARIGIPSIQLQTGAVSRWHILDAGEWWRLLTSCFVHIGLLHLAANMLSLFIIGPLLERMWGHIRFLILYVLTGVCGSAAMVMFFTSHGFGAGASGAILGITASMVTWIFLNKSMLPPPLVASWLRSLTIIAVITLLITFGMENVSASAHIGGAIAGFVLAVPLNYVTLVRGWRRALAVVGVIFVPLVYLALLSYSLRSDPNMQNLKTVGRTQGTLLQLTDPVQQKINDRTYCAARDSRRDG